MALGDSRTLHIAAMLAPHYELTSVRTYVLTTHLGQLAQREEVAVHAVARERVARHAGVVGDGGAHLGRAL